MTSFDFVTSIIPFVIVFLVMNHFRKDALVTGPGILIHRNEVRILRYQNMVFNQKIGTGVCEYPYEDLYCFVSQSKEFEIWWKTVGRYKV